LTSDYLCHFANLMSIPFLLIGGAMMFLLLCVFSGWQVGNIIALFRAIDQALELCQP